MVNHDLLPMSWEKLLSTQRFEILDSGEIVPNTSPSSQEGQDVLRTDFHIDYDRVVFSGSFRRLGRKTQVHSFARHDLTHNRLTHSVEVASVGRSIGNHVGVMLQKDNRLPSPYSPADIGAIVQVACLAHDMGNPPFGHIGEDAIRDFFRQPENQYLLSGLTDAEICDVQTYEGNAHSLRIVANLEMYRNQGGMRLTAASIATLIKYPWTSSHSKYGKHKFNIYQTELPFIRRIAEELGLPEIDDNEWLRHPLSYLMEAADDICYALLDLEDAVEIGMLDEKELEAVLSPIAEISETWLSSPRQRGAKMRGLAIGAATQSVANTFMKYHRDLMSGTFPAKDLISVCDSRVSDALNNAKQIASEKVFNHKSKVMTEIAAFPCLGSILSLLIPTVFAYKKGQSLNIRQKLALILLQDNHSIDETDTLYTAYMKVLDFVGGMTDNAAAQMAREVSGISMA